MSGAHEMKSRRQVLVIDDDESIRSLLKIYFELEGYEIETVENGERALERFEVGRFHVVLLDYSMPGMNGLEVASAIHARDPDVTIALITGMAHMLANIDLGPTGIAKIFSKPFDMDEITEWLRSLLDPE